MQVLHNQQRPRGQNSDESSEENNSRAEQNQIHVRTFQIRSMFKINLFLFNVFICRGIKQYPSSEV